jgi:hypothetical protein
MNSFAIFIADMGHRPSPDHSIDRRDNNGNYAPDNCRWATDKEQARNTRATKRLTHNNETLTIQEWSERTGIGYSTIKNRIRLGWDTNRVLTALVNGKK